MKKRKKCQAAQQLLKKTLTVAPRNPYANHPKMRKGGAVHQKSTSALRTATRRETKRQSRDWSYFLTTKKWYLPTVLKEILLRYL
jgi:hypothetical protein